MYIYFIILSLTLKVCISFDLGQNKFINLIKVYFCLYISDDLERELILNCI